MAWTQADLDAIEAAVVSGQRRVRLNGREVEYHSVGDMLKARDAIRNEVSRQQSELSGVKRPTSFRSRTSKGL
jgi:hypothetical protein